MNAKVLLVMFAMFLCVGIACAADTGTTDITGTVSEPTISITVPATFNIGALSRVGENQGNIEGVSVRSDVPWKLTVSSTDTKMHKDGPVYLDQFFYIYIPGMTDWQKPSDHPFITGNPSVSDQPITISYMQLISHTDTAGSYTIPVTFSVAAS